VAGVLELCFVRSHPVRGWEKMLGAVFWVCCRLEVPSSHCDMPWPFHESDAPLCDLVLVR